MQDRKWPDVAGGVLAGSLFGLANYVSRHAAVVALLLGAWGSGSAVLLDIVHRSRWGSRGKTWWRPYASPSTPKARRSRKRGEPDLEVSADGVQIHVRNNGPRADFTAEIAGVIYPNGNEASNKHVTLSWAGTDDISMDIPTGATRTIVLWEPKYDTRIYDALDPGGLPQLPRTYVHFFAWRDGHFPIRANETMGVRVRFVRTDPPGVTDRIVTIRNVVDGSGGRMPSEVSKP